MKLIEALDNLINVSKPIEMVLDKNSLIELTLQVMRRNVFIEQYSFTKGILSEYRGVSLKVGEKAANDMLDLESYLKGKFKNVI